MFLFIIQINFFIKFLRLIQDELVKKRWLLQPVKPTTTMNTTTVRQTFALKDHKIENFFLFRMIVHIVQVYQVLKIIYNIN
jgi:hypothetical protein